MNSRFTEEPASLTPGRHGPVLLLALLAIATAYSFRGLTRESLWADELWGVIACSKGSWRAMIAELVAWDNHPPGYQTILFYVMEIFGRSEFAIRAPSAVAGVLTVLATWHAGRRIFSRDAGLVAGMLVAGSYPIIYYSHEARAYVFLALFCTLHVDAFLAVFVRCSRARLDFVALVLSGAACAYLHYSGLVFVGCSGLLWLTIFLASSRTKSTALHGLAAFGLIALLYSPWMPSLLYQVRRMTSYWAAAPSPATIVETLTVVLGPDPWRAVSQVAVFSALVALVARRAMQRAQALSPQDKSVAVILALVAMPIAVFYVKSLISMPVYTHRHFIFAAPLIALVVGHGVASALAAIRSDAARRVALPLLLVSLGLIQLALNRELYTRSFRPDYRGAVRLIAEDREFRVQDSAIISTLDFFDYYFERLGLLGVRRHNLQQEPDPARLMRELGLARPRDIYFVEALGIPQSVAVPLLDAAYSRADRYELYGVTVIKYRARALE